jgi:hypothetical protein
MDISPYPMDECPVLLRQVLDHMQDFVTTLQLTLQRLKGVPVVSPLESVLKVTEDGDGAWWRTQPDGSSLNSEECCLACLYPSEDEDGSWTVDSDNDVFDIGCDFKYFRSYEAGKKFIEKTAKKLGWTITKE